MYGQEYSLYDIIEVTESQMKNKQLFAYRCGQIFSKTANLLRSKQIKNETLLEMGYPPETIEFICLTTMKNETIIGRFDSVEVEGVEKLLEFNSDTPTFIKELFHINNFICQEFGYKNPNMGEEHNLRSVLKDAIIGECLKINKEHLPNVVFTSHSDNIEDKNTLLYLRELSDIPSKYVPISELTIIKGEGLYDNEGERIDLLYRQTFPIESLILDEDPNDGQKVGVMLLELVRQNKLKIINPPSAFLLQNKAVMAIIWGLHEEKSPFFTEAEHNWIETYFLPTYLDNSKFKENGERYVKKPVFGREGDTVEIYSAFGEMVLEDQNKTYSEYVSVYQKYVDLPKVKFQTQKGEREGHIMTGTFLLSGSPSAFGFRVGKQITDNLSYFLPCGIREDF
ncbi:glutathionylspermidine synthase (plasmid) [Priestia aryabhattai]